MMSEAGLYDRPVLVIDPGMHTAPISRMDVNGTRGIAVTGSTDGTVRVWDIADGTLRRTIRIPRGPGNAGKVAAVAVSPDGALIAAGGWMTQTAKAEDVCLFDTETGLMRQRIGAFPNVVYHLAFSPDGTRLAVSLAGGNGVRLFDGNKGWREIAADREYGDDSYGIAFAPDGRFATSSWDGLIRLYDASGTRLASVEVDLARPCGLDFNHLDGRLAVGFGCAARVRLYDGNDLTVDPPPDMIGLSGGDLSCVAWSADGTCLYAGGRYDVHGVPPLLLWNLADAERPRALPAGRDTVIGLRGLDGGDLLVATLDPYLGRLSADGEIRWKIDPMQMDPRGQSRNFSVSQDGAIVDFNLDGSAYDFAPDERGDHRMRFDLARLVLVPNPERDGCSTPPCQTGMSVSDFLNSSFPRFDDRLLRLQTHEIARTVAIHTGIKRFVLGADRSLRAFDSEAIELWRRDVPGVVWAVNISSDGRLVVAAYGDGTIRWHRMVDGLELLAFFPLSDGENWVAWTPEGVYAATPGARGILRWHGNRGWDAAADAIPVSQIPETYRPDVIPHVLPQMGTAGAIAVAELAKIRGAVQRATGADIAPGARLHVLAIGISDYGEAARHLDLHFAAQDARDVAAALRRSQSSLFAQVSVSELVDGDATKDMIFEELSAMASAMQQGGGNDLGVILFSGHGEMLGDGRFYLLPHGAATGSEGALKASGLAATAFRDEIAAIARHGRVLVLLDACRSGGATAPADRTLRAMLTAPNVTVFTSSTAGEVSVEHPDWANGAFTEALLEALRQADYDGDALIRLSDLSRYLAERVPVLTGNRQHPDVEIIGQDVRILAAAL